MNFEENPRTIVVLRLGYTPSTRNGTSCQYSRCPSQQIKNIPFLPMLVPCLIKWLGHREYQHETSFHSSILQLRRRTEICSTWGFCKCLPTRRDMVAFLRAFWEKSEKWSVFRGRISKLGGNFLQPKKFQRLYQTQNLYIVYYDFSIKHKPIQSDGRVMNICVMPKSR